MGFNDYILTCEKENKELEKDLEYYKNQNIRLKTKNKKYKKVIDKTINFYETHKEKCVVNRDKNGKLIIDYYLPAHLSHDLLDILKEVSK